LGILVEGLKSYPLIFTMTDCLPERSEASFSVTRIFDEEFPGRKKIFAGFHFAQEDSLQPGSTRPSSNNLTSGVVKFRDYSNFAGKLIRLST
jgi:hypothetical protein